MARKPRITVLQLDPGCPLERFGEWWDGAGVRYSVVTLWDRDVPQLASAGEGLLVLGGRMSAHDRREHTWLEPLADLLADAHSIDLPILGICLGHQVLAETLGGRVLVGAEDGPEKGPATLEWLPAASDDPLVGALAAAGPATVAQSHHDVVVELPPHAVELARTHTYGNQAFRLGSAWGVQFHPEATPELIGYWSARRGREDDALVEATRSADTAIAASGRAIAEAFAAIVRG